MKYALLLLALVGMSGCGAVSNQPQTLEAELESAASFFNSVDADMLPDEFGKARMEAEVIGKDVIVIRIVDMPTGHVTIDPAVARKELRPKVCETSNAREIIERGGKIRFEIFSNIGVETTAFQIASC
jgi:hypothetical protein